MSDVISAWVDQDEMRRLAESLLSRPYGDEINRLEVDFGSQFEGFAGGPPAPTSAPVPPPSSEPKPETQPVPNPPQPPVQTQPPAQFAPSAAPTPTPVAPVAPSAQSQPHAVPPSGPSPSVVRSAVQFLKKAQAEGKAGGVIRSLSKPSPSTPPTPPSNVPAVNVSAPPGPEPRAIHSPFRRVTEAEQQPPEVTISEMTAATEKNSTGKLTRPPAPSGDEPILARVVHFGKWLKGPVGAHHFFVSNTEGKILIDEVANPKLIQVARSLAGASGDASPGAIESLHVRIGEDSILEVVPTPSQFGTLILGLIVEHPLPEELIREVRLGLEEVANARLIKRQRQPE